MPEVDQPPPRPDWPKAISLFLLVLFIGIAFFWFGRPPSFTPSPHVHALGSTADFAAVLAAHPLVLVDFHADWCAPCRELEPAIHRLAEQFRDRVYVLSVNTEQLRTLAMQQGVELIPDVRVFLNGREVERVLPPTESTIASALERHLTAAPQPP